KEKLKVSLARLLADVAQSQFGDPVAGRTTYKLCLYDSTMQLRGEYTVDPGSQLCSGAACWSTLGSIGYAYSDRSASMNGIAKVPLSGGVAGRGKVAVLGRDKGSTLPLGVAGALQGQTSAIVQLLSSDASCFDVSLPNVKKATGGVFNAKGP